jgi:hypothetical protein
MEFKRLVFGPCLLLAFCVGVAVLAPRAVAASSYAITATNVTMPLRGAGSTHYTVTAIPLTGTLLVNCQYAGPVTTAKIPTCWYGPVIGPTPVTAGQTVTGTYFLYPYGAPVPVNAPRRGLPWTGMALAGALMLGVGLRRQARGWLTLALFAGMALAGLVGISACGGSANGMTPGTYQYTISADNEANPQTPMGQGVSTTIIVTVP